MAAGNSSGDSRLHFALEKLIFDNRPVVMAVFAIITLAMAVFASQLPFT